jgi:hypothetical protein
VITEAGRRKERKSLPPQRKRIHTYINNEGKEAERLTVTLNLTLVWYYVGKWELP